MRRQGGRARFFALVWTLSGTFKRPSGPIVLIVASYERFTAWKVSYELALKMYEATDSFPRGELYGLTSQVRRAAFSVVANIAEGAAKRGCRDVIVSM